MIPVLYAASFIAYREGFIRIVPGFVLAVSDDDAQAQGNDVVLLALPKADGWEDHQVVLSRMPMVIDRYRIDVSLL